MSICTRVQLSQSLFHFLNPALTTRQRVNVESLLGKAVPRKADLYCRQTLRRIKVHFLCPTGLKAFRQQLRKNARAKGFLGLNKIKGFARQVCQSSSSRAARSAMSPFQHTQPNTCMYSSSGSSREGRSLLEEVLQQQR